MKNIVSFVICFSLLFTLSSCCFDSDNPLSGKNTDERIIMCLEETYPEHTFKIVESFNRNIDEGIFADESGMEFRVRDIVYDNTYHFACTDKYLSTILQQGNFFELAKELAEDDYQQKFVYDNTRISNDIILDDNQIDTDELADLILAELNLVKTPQVVFPAELGFSTGTINYYSKPAYGVI